jgi:hypothetical protein
VVTRYRRQGNVLAEWRRAADIKQEEIAKGLAWTRSAVSAFEGRDVHVLAVRPDWRRTVLCYAYLCNRATDSAEVQELLDLQREWEERECERWQAQAEGIRARRRAYTGWVALAICHLLFFLTGLAVVGPSAGRVVTLPAGQPWSDNPSVRQFALRASATPEELTELAERTTTHRLGPIGRMPPLAPALAVTRPLSGRLPPLDSARMLST